MKKTLMRLGLNYSDSESRFEYKVRLGSDIGKPAYISIDQKGSITVNHEG